MRNAGSSSKGGGGGVSSSPKCELKGSDNEKGEAVGEVVTIIC